MAIEPRNGLGVAYRSLQQDLVDLWKLYQTEGSLPKQEAAQILEAISKIQNTASSIGEIASAFVEIANCRPALKTPIGIAETENTVD